MPREPWLTGVEDPPRGRFPPQAHRAEARVDLSRGFEAWSFSACEGGQPMAGGNGEFESSTAPRRRLHPDSTALAVNYFPTEGKTDASAWNFGSMQAFKHAEDAFTVSRIDTDSVIAHGKQPAFRISFRGDMDSWRLLAAVLDGIRNEILEKLQQQN